jgi:lipopolysaccharide/colanic/teichoic acid biosynthesis glycosyltransferase
MIYGIFKRCFDFTAALCLFIVISPLFLLISLLVRLKLGTPIFFRQERSGQGGKTFQILKFRTMTNATDAKGHLLPDEERFTSFGRWLRSSSLDELPELINIIRGDMAVIGPRPLPPAYNDYYTEFERNRFKVRGGLIPPESMYHDSFVTWNQQLKYEADYANQVCLTMDVRILASVFKTIFRRTETDYGEYVREPLNVERTK